VSSTTCLRCFGSIGIDYADYISVDYIRTMIPTTHGGLTTASPPLVAAILRQQLAYLYGHDSPASTTTTQPQQLHVCRVDSGPLQGLHRRIHGFASLGGSTSRTCRHRSCLHRRRPWRTW
jgi:hypothetical protein